uniref:Uncharacterized protein n=1 Tax=Tetradesmus obliquus TaxID=3088 RepID=A0A383WCL3_TETOB|eukprot:jgi/Sobl393_1/2268/SZX75365.1
MLARRVAQAWLDATVTRCSNSSSSSSSSLLPLQPFTAVVAGFQHLHNSLLHTTGSRLYSQTDGTSSSSSSSSTASSSYAAGGSSTSAAAEAASNPEQPAHQAASPAAAPFVTVPKHISNTGYPETFAQTAAQQQPQAAEAAPGVSSSSRSSGRQLQQRGKRLPAAAVELPPEVLRVPLAQEVKQEAAEVTVDAYSLSRSLVGEASPGMPKLGSAAAAGTAAQQQQQQQQQPGREPLTAADAEALDKLVGLLTKDGKKSRARRLLLDAMHIIQQQLAQGKGSA